MKSLTCSYEETIQSAPENRRALTVGEFGFDKSNEINMAQMSKNANCGVGNQTYYDQWYTGRSPNFYAPLLAQIISYSQAGPVLDVGAGTGLFVEFATRWGIDCVGVDGSADAVTIGRNRWSQIRLQQHFLTDRLPFDDEAFQTVLMNQVIEHLEPSVAHNAVRECARVLRPNGMILITSPSRYNSYEANLDPTHMHMYTPKELKNLVHQLGFRGAISMDGPLQLFGSSPVGRKLMFLIFRATRWQFLSATANIRAYKL